jgi:hypothetical protein
MGESLYETARIGRDLHSPEAFWQFTPDHLRIFAGQSIVHLWGEIMLANDS